MVTNMNTKPTFKLTLLAFSLLLLGMMIACAPPLEAPISPNGTPESTIPPVPAASPSPTMKPKPTPITQDADALKGVVWQLESYRDADGNIHPALADKPAAVIFEDGHFWGETHCNNLSGIYAVKGDAMTVTLGPTTLRACVPDIASQEAGLMDGLSRVARYKIENGVLTLFDDQGQELLKFRAQTSTGLEGSSWRLVELGSGLEAEQAIARVSITFGADGHLEGNAGCNTFAGKYHTEDNRFFLDEIELTAMMCSEPAGVMDVERDFIDSLTRAATFTIMGNSLIFFDENGQRLLVLAPAETRTLTSTPWRLQSFADEKGLMRTPTVSVEISATFNEKGQVLGNAGCNDFMGNYQVDGDKLTITDLISTEMYCGEPADIMPTENAILENLRNSASFTIANDTLTIYGSDGAKLLVFTPAE